MEVHVKEISINRYGCSHQGLKIMNCEPFSLKPGQKHTVRIAFMPVDDTTLSLNRKLLLFAEHKIIPFDLQLRSVGDFQLDILGPKMYSLYTGPF